MFDFETFIALYEGYVGYFWIVVAILFLFAELNTPGLFFFISFAVGALCAAALAFLGFTFVLQCVVGLSSSLVVFVLLRKYLKSKKMSEVSYGHSHSNVDALIGSHGVVLKTITPREKGSVKVGGEIWRAQCDEDITLTEGTVVSILRVEGNSVVVKIFEKDS